MPALTRFYFGALTPLTVERYTVGELHRYLSFFRSAMREQQPEMTFEGS